jgi:hypothetical protein
MNSTKITEQTAGKFRALRIASEKWFARTKARFYKFVAYMKRPDSDRVYAAAGYIPFVGWIIPLYARENSELCQKCGKQGLVLSASAALFLLCLFFIDLLLPAGLKAVSFALIVLTYIFNIGYLTLSLYAMYNAAYMRIVRIPWISGRSDTIDI